MADDITDIYIATEAGDAGWQSLTELVAAEVEAELPISSADDTVTLSDSDGTFIVKTGDLAGSQTNQLVVADDWRCRRER